MWCISRILRWTIFIQVFFQCHPVDAVSKLNGDFYPFGPQQGDETLEMVMEDSTSDEITFPEPAYFYGARYSSAYVSENGLISFETDVPSYQNHDIRLFEHALIAAFYADIDIRNYDEPSKTHGSISYRVTEDVNLREQATRFIRSKFPDAQNFNATWLLISTWDAVGYHDGQYDKKNTFQLALIVGHTETYVDLLYDDDGIEWIRSNGKSENRRDIAGQVGFVSDDGRSRSLEYSGKDEITNINRRTNVDENGRYLFRVSHDEIQSPTDVSGRVSERLQPLDIGGPGGVVGTGAHSTDLIHDEMEDDEAEHDYDYDHPDPDGYYDGGHDGGTYTVAELPGSNPHPAPLDPAPPAPPPAPATTCDQNPSICHSNAQCVASDGTTYICQCKPGYRGDGIMCEADSQQATSHDSPVAIAPITPPPLPPIESLTGAPALPEPNIEDAEPEEVEEGPVSDPFEDGRLQEGHASAPIQTPAPFPDAVPAPAPASPPPHVPHVPPVPGPLCAQGGAHLCHSNAVCQDFSTGSCCQCQPGYIGNGRECLREGDPQRINGRFYGRINNMDIPETDLHTYVVTTDGRVYTALSQIPVQVGRSLLMLGSVGSVMGWLFSKPSSPNAYNGFTLTGGILNRTATVHISDRYTVTLQQEFSGKDAFNYLKTRLYVTGTLPEIADGTEVDYGDFKEEYVRYGPGVVKSYSSKVITAGNERFQATIDDTIRFEECQHKQFDKDHTTVVRVDRSYNVYDPKEQIVRYAGANSIEAASDAAIDPCREGNHDCTGPHMTCAREGRSFRCTCMEGFELAYPAGSDRKGMCVDLDECERSLDRCHTEADCFNTDGSYRCVCKPGYRGNGLVCEPDNEQHQQVSCANLRCDTNAECRPTRFGLLTCVCKPGYRGDGYNCAKDQTEIIGPICTSHDQCHRHGQCVYNQAIRQYQCQCRPPYSGDGRHCFLEAESCDKARNCDPNADCVWRHLPDIGGGYICQCRPGFAGDGYRCTPVEAQQDIQQCNVVNNCDPHAQCKFDNNVGRFMCQCLPGYDGDGLVCRPKQVQPSQGPRRCQSVEDCHAYGHCVETAGQDYVCECLPGFKGDGVSSCEPADQCNPGSQTGANQCDVNAACVYDNTEMAYICKCKDGYHGDGKVCTEGAATCDRHPRMCHPDAQCVYDRTGYICRCKAGFRGDGTNCQVDRTSCEGQNICHAHAQCQRNRLGEFRCVCNPGYEGDGTNCQPATDCLVNPGLCDANAVCVSENFRYVCRCKPGYHGSGQTCSADSELRGRTLVFTHGVAVVQRGLLPDDLGKQISIVPHQIAVGLDYDCQDDKLFWTDVSGHAIRSAYADGSNLTTLFSEGLNSPEGLVVDWASKNVYYTDSQLDIIGVARQDGKYRAALVKDGLVNPRALALDLFERKLYYSDWYRQKPVIGRLNLDGTGRETFITQDIALPNGLVVLHRRRQLCWADAGIQRLECIGLNGSGRRVIFAPLGYPFGLTVHNEETFYWTDWEDTKIHTVNMNGANHHSFIPSVGGSGKLYGIVMLPEQCPPGESACGVNNGGCRFICLPDSRGSRSCVCPDNIPESECNELNGGTVS